MWTSPSTRTHCRLSPSAPSSGKTGARGLRSIMEAILLDTMFELPALEGVREVVISEEVVSGNARPLYIYSEQKEKKGNVSA